MNKEIKIKRHGYGRDVHSHAFHYCKSDSFSCVKKKMKITIERTRRNLPPSESLITGKSVNGIPTIPFKCF
ncbi:hypothetical protein [Bacillus sp. JJ1773]|uniref:hypothetical protein n=1 Tax=Bacillus sp. JJ1773 TaxID=3122965 RepID=UPI00300030EC